MGTVAAAVAAPSGVPTPTLTKPPAGLEGPPDVGLWYDLDPFGYPEDE